MREYQVQGLRWLLSQHDLGAGGILGDEMGLGKTLQVISLLAFLKEERKEAGPHLVVAPLSVINAWTNECHKWAPSLRLVTFHGSLHERERIRHQVLNKGGFDVCMTTYEMLSADLHGFVSRNMWNYLVLDEAHRIKNENSLIGQAVRKIHCNNRLLITGTPLQNNLHELWVRPLAGFCHPAHAVFSSRTHSCHQPVAALMQSAHRLLQPLMLRRLKREVLGDELPPKIETKVVVPLSKMQRFLYSAILTQDLSALISAADRKSTKRSAVPLEYARLSSLLMHLRKVCNHPYMFKAMDPLESDDRMVHASSKLIVLDKLLTKLKAEGRKCLVYSQFTSMLDILGDFLTMRGYKFLRLDGATPAARRRYEISCFENSKSDKSVYLISTRAGGLGITLVAADTVILYDSDWNPTADLQAMDRVHRIGQKNAVHCYRLVTQGTVEERIVRAAEHKSMMNALVMR
ncbi:P-loop containing nucleoside triphosphate hydrolase protein, partial [Baffinella frigidus]